MEETKKVSGGLIALMAITIVPMIILRGYIISLYWDWFVVASFGISSISIAAAIGISALLHYVTVNHNVTTKIQKMTLL